MLDGNDEKPYPLPLTIPSVGPEPISGLLTSIGKTSREALISKEPTKFVVKISVNSRCNRVYQK
jgi:hypothetical protein